MRVPPAQRFLVCTAAVVDRGCSSVVTVRGSPSECLRQPEPYRTGQDYMGSQIRYMNIGGGFEFLRENNEDLCRTFLDFCKSQCRKPSRSLPERKNQRFRTSSHYQSLRLFQKVVNRKFAIVMSEASRRARVLRNIFMGVFLA